jgi:hypothetical protein
MIRWKMQSVKYAFGGICIRWKMFSVKYAFGEKFIRWKMIRWNMHSLKCDSVKRTWTGQNRCSTRFFHSQLWSIFPKKSVLTNVYKVKFGIKVCKKKQFWLQSGENIEYPIQICHFNLAHILVNSWQKFTIDIRSLFKPIYTHTLWHSLWSQTTHLSNPNNRANRTNIQERQLPSAYSIEKW